MRSALKWKTISNCIASILYLLFLAAIMVPCRSSPFCPYLDQLSRCADREIGSYGSQLSPYSLLLCFLLHTAYSWLSTVYARRRAALSADLQAGLSWEESAVVRRKTGEVRGGDGRLSCSTKWETRKGNDEVRRKKGKMGGSSRRNYVRFIHRMDIGRAKRLLPNGTTSEPV
jgi:hypothetical protein